MATGFDTQVALMAGVPLDPMYKHTLTFSTLQAQTQYFNSMIRLNAEFTYMSYQRRTSGVIKVEASISLLDEVNYLRFINQNHENKAFYAFIDSIEYISDSTVAISYTIDVLQTWMFAYYVNPCYIEREHANSDEIGDNRVAEGLDTGPYVEADWEPIDYWNSTVWEDESQRVANSNFVVIATQAPNGTQGTYQMNGVVGSCFIRICYNLTQLDDLIQEFYNGATSSLEPIVSITMFPHYYQENMYDAMSAITWQLNKDQTVGFGPFIGYDPHTTLTKSYTPKNNKMYCYPYNYMIFEGPEGNSNILKFEDFKNNNAHYFYSRCSVYPAVETICAPKNYENYANNSRQTSGYDPNTEIHDDVNTKYALYSKSYPVCAVASDAFSAWWAQNRSYYPTGGAYVEAADAVASSRERNGEEGGVVGWFKDRYRNASAWVSSYWNFITEPAMWAQNAGTGFSRAAERVGRRGNRNEENGNRSQDLKIIGDDADSIGSAMAAVNGHKALPDSFASKAANGGILHTLELDCYKIRYTKIRPEYAQIIDNYFTCFGYATHVVKRPNITGRLNWNYVQTKGCTITGNLPSEAQEEIAAIFDRGVTFWHNPNYIHDYSQPNYIVT